MKKLPNQALVNISSGRINNPGYIAEFPGYDGATVTRFWYASQLTKAGLPDRRARGEALLDASDIQYRHTNKYTVYRTQLESEANLIRTEIAAAKQRLADLETQLIKHYLQP